MPWRQRLYIFYIIHWTTSLHLLVEFLVEKDWLNQGGVNCYPQLKFIDAMVLFYSVQKDCINQISRILLKIFFLDNNNFVVFTTKLLTQSTLLKASSSVGKNLPPVTCFLRIINLWLSDISDIFIVRIRSIN